MWRGVSGPFEVVVDPGVFIPSSTSKVLAEALRVDPGDSSSTLAAGAAYCRWSPPGSAPRKVIGTDFSDAAVTCATANAQRLGLSDVAEFRAGNLLEPVDGERANVVIADVSGIPDAVAAGDRLVP